jgi:polysaccharide deacetylase family protein (PEP-CTERM system associated)
MTPPASTALRKFAPVHREAAAQDTRVVNAMTIDVEDYFHVSVFDGLIPRDRWSLLESRVAANTERILAIFGEAGIRATFFILGWVAERYPEVVRQIAWSGHEIASHGYGHRLVYDMTPRQFREDLRRAKNVLQMASGVPVHGYRAPSYSIIPRSLWALDVLIEEGFRYDASIFPIHHDRYGLPLTPRHPYVVQRECGSIIEVPGSTIRVGPLNLPVAGGGYFRLLPYEWTRWGIDRLNRVERRPAVFYLHPWEIDPGQPRLEASRLSCFRHYRNLDKTEPRLEALLREFRFSTVMAMLERASTSEAGASISPPIPYVW